MTSPQAEVLARVVEVGLATIQDGGRPGHSGVGVPAAGAWHRPRYLAATALVKGVEDPQVPAIELLAGRFSLVTRRAAVMAVVGSSDWTVDGRAVSPGQSILVHAGAQVAVQQRGPGPVYLALAGWRAPRLLDSASTDAFSGLEPLELGPGLLLSGDDLGGSIHGGSFLREVSQRRGRVRVMGHAGATDALTSVAWRVVSTARSGTRLQGGGLPRVSSQPSTPVVVGAIQATPAGEAIVLGPDGALTGGYPIIGVVCTADLARISELEVGEAVRFEEVDVTEAVRAHAAAERGRAVVHPRHLGQEGSIAGG